MDEIFTVSTDKSKLDLNAIHDYLSQRSYWAQGRSFEVVEKSIKESLCFGIYKEGTEFVGFARVVSDFCVFAYLLDVFILEPYRGQGLGKKLLNNVFSHNYLQSIKRWGLVTRDAHELYKKFGFELPKKPECHMEKVDLNLS